MTRFTVVCFFFKIYKLCIQKEESEKTKISYFSDLCAAYDISPNIYKNKNDEYLNETTEKILLSNNLNENHSKQIITPYIHNKTHTNSIEKTQIQNIYPLLSEMLSNKKLPFSEINRKSCNKHKANNEKAKFKSARKNNYKIQTETMFKKHIYQNSCVKKVIRKRIVEKYNMNEDILKNEKLANTNQLQESTINKQSKTSFQNFCAEELNSNSKDKITSFKDKKTCSKFNQKEESLLKTDTCIYNNTFSNVQKMQNLNSNQLFYPLQQSNLYLHKYLQFCSTKNSNTEKLTDSYIHHNQKISCNLSSDLQKPFLKHDPQHVMYSLNSNRSHEYDECNYINGVVKYTQIDRNSQGCTDPKSTINLSATGNPDHLFSNNKILSCERNNESNNELENKEIKYIDLELKDSLSLSNEKTVRDSDNDNLRNEYILEQKNDRIKEKKIECFFSEQYLDSSFEISEKNIEDLQQNIKFTPFYKKYDSHLALKNQKKYFNRTRKNSPIIFDDFNLLRNQKRLYTTNIKEFHAITNLNTKEIGKKTTDKKENENNRTSMCIENDFLSNCVSKGINNQKTKYYKSQNLNSIIDNIYSRLGNQKTNVNQPNKNNSIFRKESEISDENFVPVGLQVNKDVKTDYIQNTNLLSENTDNKLIEHKLKIKNEQNEMSLQNSRFVYQEIKSLLYKMQKDIKENNKPYTNKEIYYILNLHFMSNTYYHNFLKNINSENFPIISKNMFLHISKEITSKIYDVLLDLNREYLNKNNDQNLNLKLLEKLSIINQVRKICNKIKFKKLKFYNFDVTFIRFVDTEINENMKIDKIVKYILQFNKIFNDENPEFWKDDNNLIILSIKDKNEFKINNQHNKNISEYKKYYDIIRILCSKIYRKKVLLGKLCLSTHFQLKKTLIKYCLMVESIMKENECLNVSWTKKTAKVYIESLYRIFFSLDSILLYEINIQNEKYLKCICIATKFLRKIFLKRQNIGSKSYFSSDLKRNENFFETEGPCEFIYTEIINFLHIASHILERQ